MLHFKNLKLINLSNRKVSYWYCFEGENDTINLLFPRTEEKALSLQDTLLTVPEFEELLSQRAQNEDKKVFEKTVEEVLKSGYQNGNCKAERNDDQLVIKVVSLDSFPF